MPELRALEEGSLEGWGPSTLNRNTRPLGTQRALHFMRVFGGPRATQGIGTQGLQGLSSCPSPLVYRGANRCTPRHDLFKVTE